MGPFVRLSESVYISRPSERAGTGTGSASASADTNGGLAPLRTAIQPSHVVIFGWMDAPLRLVLKYAVPYTLLFPDSTVVIKLSDGRSYLAGEAARRAALGPVLAAVRGTNTGAGAGAGAGGAGIVIHSFSDGGGGNLALFAPTLGAGARVHSVVMDSSPGRSTPSSGASAFTMPLSHRPLLRAVARALVYVGLHVLRLYAWIRGLPPRGEAMRQTLNDPKAWPAHSLPPRLYLYSKADKLIPYKAVEEHAHRAAVVHSPGSRPHLLDMEPSPPSSLLELPTPAISLRRWSHAPHCSIGRHDPRGYWAALAAFYSATLNPPPAST